MGIVIKTPIPIHQQSCSSKGLFFLVSGESTLNLRDAVRNTGLLNEFAAPFHPALESIFARIQGEVVPHRIFRISVSGPDALGHIGGRPRRKLSLHTGVVDIENSAKQLDSVLIMLLRRVGFAAAVSEALPPGHSPPERQKDMSELIQETQVCLLRDLFPFDVVKVPFQLPEPFDLQHAADNPRQLRR